MDHSLLDTGRKQARTLEEVGRLAGVSRNTVSLALSNDPRVRPETRERILRVVRETGYHRNSAAAALAGGLTRILAVVEFGSPAYLSDRAYFGYLAGIEEATSINRFDLLLLSARREPGPKWLTELARARRFDGLVLLGADTDRVAVAALLVAQIPVVHVGRRVIGQYDLPYVTPGYHSAGKLGAKRLLDRGAHRIIYYVAGVKQPESRADLFGGIEAAVAEERARGGEIACVSLDVYEIEELGEKLVVEAGIGIFAHGTKLGMAVWHLLQRCGQDVPLTIYDDEGWLEEALPQVDWIRPRQRLMGYQAALLALALIQGQSLSERHLVIAPEISWRDEADADDDATSPCSTTKRR